MEEEQVSYESLQDLLRTERRGNKLTALPPRFWAEVRDFLQEVYARFRAEQAKDPFSRKVMLLTDEVKNARHAAKALWALRERKLAMLALAHSHERQRPAGITPDESVLYDRLLATLDEARGSVLEGTEPASASAAAPDRAPEAPGPPPTVASQDAAPADASGAVVEAGPDRRGGATEGARAAAVDAAATPPAGPGQEAPEPAATPAVPSDVARDDGLVTIRALGDIPPFVGPDMQTYILREGDIATVPPTIASLLEKRRKAAVIETA